MHTKRQKGRIVKGNRYSKCDLSGSQPLHELLFSYSRERNGGLKNAGFDMGASVRVKKTK